MTGDLNSFESLSIKYQGLQSGRENAFPTIGQGSGPGGYSESVINEEIATFAGVYHSPPPVKHPGMIQNNC